MGHRDMNGAWVDSCLHKLAPGEPFVVLRGQDKFAPVVLRMWLAMAYEVDMDPAKLREMELTIAEMEKWQPRKIPD